MGWPLWLAWRELWNRRWRSLLSLLALALSVGLMVATGSIGALMQASVGTPAPLLGRPADLWISSAYDVDYDLPAGLAARVEAVAGVTEVQPLLRRPVRLQTPHPDTLTLMGVEPAPYFAFHDLPLAAGGLPSAETPGVVAMAPWAFVRDLRLGQPITLTTPSGDVALPIVGLIEVESLEAVQQGLVLYVPLDTMGELFGLHGVVTALEVRLTPGTTVRHARAELEQALGPAYAASVASQTGQGIQLWQRLVLGALIFVDGLTLVGSVGLVYAVFASAAQAHRRQVGLLRAVGAQRRQVLVILMIEAGLLGLTGGGLGTATGLLFSWIGANLVLRSNQVPSLPPLPAAWPLLAALVGLLSGLAGAIGPALRAARQPPLTALHAVYEPRRPADGGQLWQAMAHLICPFLSEAHMAAANLARERGRAVLMVGSLALILGMALGNLGVLSLLGEELAVTFGRLTDVDYLLLPGLTTISLRELAGQDTSDVPPLPPELMAALRNLKDQAWLMEGTTANIKTLQVFPGQPTLLLDIEGYAQMGGFRFLAGNWSSALEAFSRGPAVLLTPVVARRLDVGLGDRVRLHTLQGPVDFQVAGIGDSEFTTCILNLADGAAYFGANEVNAVAVQVRPEADGEVVQRALLDAVQTHDGTLLSLSQASNQLREMFHQARRSITLLIGVTGLVAGLGVVNAMLVSVGERRREIGLLRAVGATRSQIGRLILAEAAMLGTIAALIGAGLAWALTLLFLGVARSYLGLGGEGTASLAAWLPLLIASGAGVGIWPLLAMLGGLAPALHAAWLPIIEALYEITPG